MPQKRGGALGRTLGLGAGYVLLSAALLLLGALVWLRSTSLPRLSGEMKLSSASPRAAVSITRDRFGVPHIRAQSDEDAVFALGFVHWQDRAWQMDFQRRVAAGRLAEVLGSAALPQDKFLRTWGFERAAQSALTALSPQTRRLVAAYTAGVNAAMAQGKVAPEFRILKYAPQPWQDVDSVSWSKMMAFDLGGNYEDEVIGASVVARLGLSGLGEVLPPYPPGAPTILSATNLNAERPVVAQHAPRPPLSALPPSTIRALQANLNAARQLGMQAVPGKGSNDWVIGGQRSASGKPFLANDPHLALSSPMLWYLADMQGQRLKAIGASIPGLPAIVIGRNERVAWGVTNVNPDVQDLFIEPPSARLSEHTEIIHVKGAADVSLVVRQSVHGPIISDYGAADLGPRVALRWTALLPGDTTMDAFLGLNYAQNWTDFKAALRSYVAPSQNFVYADIEGNTGYYAPGNIPIRRGWDGSLPVAGNGRHEWQGFIPFEELPHTFNPPEGLVISANNKVTPDTYAYFLANNHNWAEPYRAQRITQLLSAKARGLTLDDIKKVQLDTVSLLWSDLRALLLATQPTNEAQRQALAHLRAWDGNETVGSVPATLFEAWLMPLQEMARDEVPGQLLLSGLAVKNQLAHDGPLCRNAAARLPNCAAELRLTLQRALDDLKQRLGPDMNTWTYGKLHQVASNHQAFGGVKALAPLFNHSAPTPGGTNTVNVARPEHGSFKQTHGPSYRQIIDLSDMNNSVFVGSLGQGGNPLDPHASDQQSLWVSGQYLPMSTDPADWGATQTLKLSPVTP